MYVFIFLVKKVQVGKDQEKAQGIRLSNWVATYWENSCSFGFRSVFIV